MYIYICTYIYTYILRIGFKGYKLSEHIKIQFLNKKSLPLKSFIYKNLHNKYVCRVT